MEMNIKKLYLESQHVAFQWILILLGGAIVMRTTHNTPRDCNTSSRPLIAAEWLIFSDAVNLQYLVLQAKIHADSENYYNYCIYDSDIASGYGVGAFLFLLASQVLIMFASKCFCCGKPLSPGGSRACAVILFITCW